MTDAGYRWAYCQLERPQVVCQASRVSAADVFATASYWRGSEVDESPWLRDEILPIVRAFLETHGEHDIVYGEYEQIAGDEPRAFLEWLELGPNASPTPRWFAEVLYLRTWAEVVMWVREHQQPWWWSDEELKDIARVRFCEEVAKSSSLDESTGIDHNRV